MKVFHFEKTIIVSDLNAAYDHADLMSGYEGNDYLKRQWLLTFYQLRVMKGFRFNVSNSIKLLTATNSKLSNIYMSLNNDSKYRHICFNAAGNLSKASYNFKNKRTNKIGTVLNTIERNKIIIYLLECCIRNQNFNGREIMQIGSKMNVNKYLSDDFDYDTNIQSLYDIHCNILLYVERYATAHVKNCIGHFIGNFWKNEANLEIKEIKEKTVQLKLFLD